MAHWISINRTPHPRKVAFLEFPLLNRDTVLLLSTSLSTIDEYNMITTPYSNLHFLCIIFSSFAKLKNPSSHPYITLNNDIEGIT